MGQNSRYSYDHNGLVKTITDAKGQITTYNYDAANHLSNVVYHDGTQDSFTYDSLGNLIGYTGADGVSGVLEYDALNRKIAETVNYGSFTKSFQYSYDAYGNKDSYTSANDIVHSYAHDLSGRVTAMSVDGQTINLSYNKTRLAQINYPNGVTTNYSYNGNDWLSNLNTSGPNGTLLQRDYSFDGTGNITNAVSTQGSTNYTYDPTNQLTEADHPAATALSDETYSYDPVGNRLNANDISGLISYNTNNELIGHSTAQYQYDTNGNTVQKTENGQVTTYNYNSRNRLAAIHLADGRLVSYRYDPFGRRISKSVAGTTTSYAYTDEGLVGEYDANGNWQKSYGWKPNGLWGTDPVYQRTPTGLYYYHNDHLGTPQRLSDNTGAIVWSAGYAAFGRATVDPFLTAVENNLRFAGQYFDQESGLHYNYQRFYDPKAGRYTQVDPIGFFAGDVNLFRYVYQNPIMNFDSNGLWVVGYGGSAGIGFMGAVDISGGGVVDGHGSLAAIGTVTGSAGLQTTAGAGATVYFSFADKVGDLNGPSFDINIRLGISISFSIPIDYETGKINLKNTLLSVDYMPSPLNLGFGFGPGGTIILWENKAPLYLINLLRKQRGCN